MIRQILVSGLILICTGPLVGCNRGPRFTMPEEAVGQTWFPAPPRGLHSVPRYGLQILDDPRRGVQEVWFRHRYRDGLDTQIDRLHAPGSVLWSPDGRWVAINHRDYASLGDFLLFQIEKGRPVERGGMMDHIQALWQRLHPEAMQSLLVRAARWTEDSRQLLVLVTGTPETPGAAPIRQAMWLDPRDGVVRLAEVPEEVWTSAP